MTSHPCDDPTTLRSATGGSGRGMVYVVLSELGGAGAGRGGGVEEAGGLGPRVEAVAAARQEGKTAAERNRSENSSSPWMEPEDVRRKLGPVGTEGSDSKAVDGFLIGV